MALMKMPCAVGSGSISEVWFGSERSSSASTITFSNPMDIVFVGVSSSDTSDINTAFMTQDSLTKGDSKTIDGGTISLSSDGQTITKGATSGNFLVFIGIKY